MHQVHNDKVDCNSLLGVQTIETEFVEAAEFGVVSGSQITDRSNDARADPTLPVPVPAESKARMVAGSDADDRSRMEVHGEGHRQH